MNSEMVTVNGRQIDYQEGMTVADALRAAGEQPDTMTLVVVDGRVLLHDRLAVTPLADGAQIRLLPLLSGG